MNPPTIERNGIQVKLASAIFSKKSDNAGKTYFRPEIPNPTLMTLKNAEGADVEVLTNIEVLKWVGIDDAIEILSHQLDLTFRDILLDNIGEDGTFNEAQYLLDCADFTAGVQKLADVTDQLDGLNDQMLEHLENDAYILEGNTPVSEQAAEIHGQVLALRDRIRPLKVKKATLLAKNAEKAKKRAESKAKKEAAEKAKAGTAPVAA